jgi:hypothetical protein
MDVNSGGCDVGDVTSSRSSSNYNIGLIVNEEY